MNPNVCKRFAGTAALAAALLMFTGVSGLFSEEKISPLSDYQYKKDFAQYEEIKKEADAQKRADLLMAFLKEKPISRMLLYVATDYLACAKPSIDNKDWAKAIAMYDALWAALPTKQSIEAAQIPAGVEEFLKEQLVPAQKLVLGNTLQAYAQSNNLPKAAETAERLYEISPDKAVRQAAMDIYLRIPNFDKYLEHAQKALAETPIEQGGYTVALQMVQVYIQKQDMASANDMIGKILAVYGDKVPEGLQEAQWNATRAWAYGILATQSYAGKDYVKAQELFEKVVAFDTKKDDAYYYLGMSRWQNKNQAGAIDAFAKCVVLNKATAAKGRTRLEELYKAEHKGVLDGLDQVLAKAKADLGI